jgi:CRP-like cAMP-binding protein
VKALHGNVSVFGDLPPHERQLVDRAMRRQVRALGPHKDIIREGENPGAVNVLIDGWAMRYKQLSDGRRQILSFFFPGDICDANVFLLKEMDHSVGTLTHVTYAEISRRDFEELEESPAIASALRWRELVTMAIQREWTTNIGQRSAYERMAHLFCEIFVLLRRIGLVRDSGFAFPLTQTDIADATGMTPVHVNRTLQRLRHDGLIELKNRRMVLPDPDALMRAAQFNPNYLHLDGIKQG